MTATSGPDPAWYTGCSSRTPMKPTPDRRDSADFSEDLSVDPGRALASLEQELGTLGQGEGTELQRLEQLLTEARRAVQADAGTIFLRHNGALRFAVVQNESLARRLSVGAARRGS